MMSWQRLRHVGAGAFALAVTVALLATWPVAAARGAEFVDISPDDSGPLPGCPGSCPSGGSGGRVHNLASSPAHPNEVYAASELGGLFKSDNGGATWRHLDGHLPTKAWDVAVDPGGSIVYATSFYDGRVQSLSGVEVSTDGGATWSRPALLSRSPTLCSAARGAEPSGFGIAIRAGAPNEVLAGTNCGLARSTDFGASWERFDPTPGDGEAQSVWDVVALPGGLTYACGQEGIVRSLDGRTGWTSLPDPSDATGPYRGYCSLAADPDFPNAVFVVLSRTTYFDPIVDVRETAYFASFDGGAHWQAMPHPDGSAQKRVPMVTTNRRSYGIDVWVGAGNLFRIPCVLLGIAVACPVTDMSAWSGTFTDGQDPRTTAKPDPLKGHGDSGDVLFDPTATSDGCPLLYSSDGGIYRNTITPAPACQDPTFASSQTGLHAQLLLGMAGVRRPGKTAESLYEALQDVGVFGTLDAGSAKPTWVHGAGADVFDVVPDTSQVIVNDGRILREDPGPASPKVVPNTPGPATQFYTVFTDVVDRWGPRSYVLATRDGGSAVRYTTNLTLGTVQSSTVAWKSLAWPAAAAIPCGVRAARAPSRGKATVSFYVTAGDCLWRSANQLWTRRFGPRARAVWKRLDVNSECPGGGFGIVAVDSARPARLYASCTATDPPRMIRSEDGGTTWQTDQVLTDLMTGGGTFVARFDDPHDGATFGGVQPVMVAFDPKDRKTLVAGGYESGVFLSTDDGKTWALLTDPVAPGTSHVPHLPRPFYAYFDHDVGRGQRAVYIGSVGRGVWRITYGRRRAAVS